MKSQRLSSALIGLALCLFATAFAAASPRLVKATYAGYMNGLSIGVISEVFEADDARYRIVSETKPVGLAALVQRQPLRFASRGRVTRDGLRPSRFEARRTAADPPQVSADFDWAHSLVTLKHNGRTESLPLAPGTQDRLSIMYEFMYMRLDNARSVDFSMTNGRKLDRYRYRITPEVEIDTALGRLKTLHLVKEREPGDTVTEVWVSPQHRNLAVRMVIVERDGLRFEQAIQSLVLHD